MRITVLSPHRDDAIFSLGGALQRWTTLAWEVRIVNFFTTSSYAPRTVYVDVFEISEIRRREDRRAIRAVNAGIRAFDLGQLDAPLRLGIGVDRVTLPDSVQCLPADEGENLAALTRRFTRTGLVVAPLGLGEHIDHQAVRMAAMQAVGRAKLGFYEDLPYATWTDTRELHVRVNAIEKQMQTELRPVTIALDHAGILHKFRLVGKYTSQITREDASAIAKHSFMHGGERIWLPRCGKKSWSLGATGLDRQRTRHSVSANFHSSSTQVPAVAKPAPSA